MSPIVVAPGCQLSGAQTSNVARALKAARMARPHIERRRHTAWRRFDRNANAASHLAWLLASVAQPVTATSTVGRRSGAQPANRRG